MVLSLFDSIFMHDTFALFSYTTKKSPLYNIFSNIDSYTAERLKEELLEYFSNEALNPLISEFEANEAARMLEVVCEIIEGGKSESITGRYLNIMRKYK